MRAALPAAHDQPELALRDGLPARLEALAQALESSAPGAAADSGPQERAGAAHGFERAESAAYSLEQVLGECQALRRVLFEVLEERGPLDPVERDILLDALDIDVRAAAGAFSRWRAADEAGAGALEALRRSMESFRTLAEAIPQQVWSATSEGALDFVNPRVLEYFARTSDEVLGAGWQGVVHPDDLPRCVERWTDALRTTGAYEVEFRLRRADGVYRWHLARALPVRDSGGAAVKWFGTNTDIDDARQIRAELERRTEFERHLIGIVSHDLRNPLGAIVNGAASLLRMEELSERATKIARRVQSSAERAARMIGDLLDFTQARFGGGLALRRHPEDLYAVVSAAVDDVEIAHPDRTVELTRAGDTRGTWDADRLSQIVTNLVTNALKYSPAATPVRVHVAGPHDQNVVTLSVHNEGAPIPAERVSRIFHPYQRASEQLDRNTRSVGLGLYIVDAIARAHGGEVEVTSTVDAGTTFTVRLPRA